MPPASIRPFLEVFPREIRDLIYTFVLASPSGLVTLAPWTVDVAKQLNILRTCKQIHRECKNIIWVHNDLRLRVDSQIYQKFVAKDSRLRRCTQIHFDLEVLDRDELQWALRGIKALKEGDYARDLHAISFRTVWERPRHLAEFQEVLLMQNAGEKVDGRLYKAVRHKHQLVINTGWPRFAHWGKQSWMKAMLMDPSGVQEAVMDIYNVLGGDLYLDREVVFQDHIQVAPFRLNPKDGEIWIALPIKRKDWSKRKPKPAALGSRAAQPLK